MSKCLPYILHALSSVLLLVVLELHQVSEMLGLHVEVVVVARVVREFEQHGGEHFVSENADLRSLVLYKQKH